MGERSLHTREVAGSKPAAPINTALQAVPSRQRLRPGIAIEETQPMAYLNYTRGLTKRRGLFWAGTPTDSYFFDDGVVFVYPSAALAALPVFGAIGAGLAAAAAQRAAKRMQAEARDTSAIDFHGSRRNADLLLWKDVSAARLEPKSSRMQQLFLDTADGTHRLRYPKKTLSDQDASAMLSRTLGDRLAAPRS